MTVELLNDIVASEKRAEEIVREAFLEAKEIQRNAEIQGENMVRNTADKEYAKAKLSVHKAEEDVQEIVKKKQIVNTELCNEVRKKALGNLDKAVETILERIVSMNGNC